MTSKIYELIGRLVVLVVRLKFSKQMRIAAGVGAGALLVGGYLAARRSPPEG
jgi:hypothetical protein